MAQAQYVGVSGVARKVTQPYIGVYSVARKVKNGSVGVNGVARQFLSGGKPASAMAVGSTVYLRENGTLVEYIVVHQGLPSTMYDSSCNGTWLLRKNLYTTRAWNENYNSFSGDNEKAFSNAPITTYLNGTFLSLFDAAIQNAIKQVKIPYVTVGLYGSYGTVMSGANGHSTKIFLLAANEIGLPAKDFSGYSLGYNLDDGALLSYFTAGSSSSANTKRVAYLNGTAGMWWTRTKQANGGQVVDIMTDGTPHNSSQNASEGIRPALILPSGAKFNPSTNEFIGV